jgi:hypothetical protein
MADGKRMSIIRDQFGKMDELVMHEADPPPPSVPTAEAPPPAFVAPPKRAAPNVFPPANYPTTHDLPPAEFIAEPPPIESPPPMVAIDESGITDFGRAMSDLMVANAMRENNGQRRNH